MTASMPDNQTIEADIVREISNRLERFDERLAEMETNMFAAGLILVRRPEKEQTDA